MRAERGFFAQFRAVLPVLVRLYVPPLLVLGSVALLAARGVIGTGRLTHDPNHLADLPPYTGAISQIGALLWCAAASICFFSSRLLAGSPARFLRCAGLLTTVLLVDDMFLVHDQVFPQYFGLHQQLPIVAYALAMVAWVHCMTTSVGNQIQDRTSWRKPAATRFRGRTLPRSIVASKSLFW